MVPQRLLKRGRSRNNGGLWHDKGQTWTWIAGQKVIYKSMNLAVAFDFIFFLLVGSMSCNAMLVCLVCVCVRCFTNFTTEKLHKTKPDSKHYMMSRPFKIYDKISDLRIKFHEPCALGLSWGSRNLAKKSTFSCVFCCGWWALSGHFGDQSRQQWQQWDHIIR